MRLFHITFRDENGTLTPTPWPGSGSGEAQLWARSEEAAEAIRDEIRKNAGDPNYPVDIDAHEVPTSVTGLVNYLNRHCQSA